MPHFHHTIYQREEGAWFHMSVCRCSFLAFVQTCCRRAETLRTGCMVVMYVRVFFVSRVSDDDADQAPSAERPFGVLWTPCRSALLPSC